MGSDDPINIINKGRLVVLLNSPVYEKRAGDIYLKILLLFSGL